MLGKKAKNARLTQKDEISLRDILHKAVSGEFLLDCRKRLATNQDTLYSLEKV